LNSDYSCIYQLSSLYYRHGTPCMDPLKFWVVKMLKESNSKMANTLGWFYILVLWNSTENMDGYISMLYVETDFLRYMPRSVTADHYCTSILRFLRSSIMLSALVYVLTFLPSVYEGSFSPQPH
jgi:hypothetical protein